MLWHTATILLLVAASAASVASTVSSLRRHEKPLEPGDAPPQGRESPHAPSEFSQLYTFGYDSDYYCSGRISDEPRKMRLSCTKNPQRKMNCQCDDQTGNSLLVKCRCGPAFTSSSKKINLEDKFVLPWMNGRPMREGCGAEHVATVLILNHAAQQWLNTSWCRR